MTTTPAANQFALESEHYGVKICLKHAEHGVGFILLRPDDVEWFIVDLQRAKEAALTLRSEAEK